jgi:hypothetical protein
VPRCFKQSVCRVSSVELNEVKCLVGIHSPASKNENTEVEGSTALEAVTRRQQMKIQLTEKA